VADSLDAFFDAAVPFLRGHTDAAALRDALGPPPSERHARFDFYRRLMAANRGRVARSLYRGLAKVMGPSFDEAVTRLFDRFPTGHWDLNQAVARMGEVIAADWPDRPELAQLADYEWLHYQAARSPEAFDADRDAVNPTAIARAYTHDVPGYARAARGCDSTTPDAPAPTSITVIVFRDPETLTVRYLQPDLPRLLVFAAASGEADPATAAQSGVTAEAARAATERLIRVGVLGAPARDRSEALFR